ncbi:PDR/VanB family oxidoreductase [Cupriavidus basilensis]|uniref:PDR/VanB family oxidoreductase n=1 Tax=Cupriavidus basilensis TaxID=68895 RepID=A0ABT6AKR8_9BURK|nr:PDR/VanB family oxidoreductase [Cupriavidus basilensis]MDF3833204.1 PDR/VanB family oxidoreductase [Cupriavidus basilensis]
MDTDNTTVRVVRKQFDADDICIFTLQPLDGSAVPAFQAGAHIDVHLPNGMIRQYSLCNPPHVRDHYLIGVLKDPATRGGSQSLHEEVTEGDVLTISLPRNLFSLADHAQRHLLLAGGIGITPLIAMAWHLEARRANYHLHYYTRSPQRTAFLEQIRTSSLAGNVSHWFDSAPSQEKPTVAELLRRAPRDTHVYVCGPAGFINHVIDECGRVGWPAGQVHFERFTAAPSTGETEFTVVIRSSGQRIPIAGDTSVVQALECAGISIPVSCEQGICGTCLTRICAGVPDHRDQYLTKDERMAANMFTPCCSRSLTPELVLDL